MGEGSSGKSEWVLLLKGTLKAFDALKQVCMSAPVLAFTNYMKEFLLEADASEEGLGQYCPKSRQMGNTTQSPMVAELLQLMRKTTIPPSLSS